LIRKIKARIDKKTFSSSMIEISEIMTAISNLDLSFLLAGIMKTLMIEEYNG